MLSSKLQNDLMAAYHKVYEEKTGHAAGDSDTEKQASQLASDVRYKAKGKLPEGATKEEKMKIFLQILAKSPAPNVVKSMAKQKLLGESVVKEMRFDDGEEGKKKRKEKLRKKRGLTKAQMDKHPQFKELKEMGIKFPKDDEPIIKPEGGVIKKGKERDGKFKLKKGVNLDKAHYELNGDPLQEEEKAPRKQKGAMAYDGPNKERSEAADRVIAKTKTKRKKMKEEFVDEMSCPSPKVVDTSSKPKEKKMTPNILDKIRKLNTGAGSQFEQVVHEKMDAVGKEDKDIDNDGDHDSTDKYLLKRRKAIGKAIAKKRGRVKEGFSAWRVDLDFQEQVKK